MGYDSTVGCILNNSMAFGQSSQEYYFHQYLKTSSYRTWNPNNADFVFVGSYESTCDSKYPNRNRPTMCWLDTWYILRSSAFKKLDGSNFVYTSGLSTHWARDNAAPKGVTFGVDHDELKGRHKILIPFVARHGLLPSARKAILLFFVGNCFSTKFTDFVRGKILPQFTQVERSLVELQSLADIPSNLTSILRNYAAHKDPSLNETEAAAEIRGILSEGGVDDFHRHLVNVPLLYLRTYETHLGGMDCATKHTPLHWGHVTYDELVRRSEFCLVMGGHTKSTSRSHEVMLANCLPVYVGYHNNLDCLAFSDVVPYERFSLFFRHNVTALEIMEVVTAIPLEVRHQMRAVMNTYLPYLQVGPLQQDFHNLGPKQAFQEVCDILNPRKREKRCEVDNSHNSRNTLLNRLDQLGLGHAR